MSEPRDLPILPSDTGRRLDVFLAEKLGLSRAQVRRLLARGAVSVDGRVVAADAKGQVVARDATIRVAPFTRPEHQAAVPEAGAALAVLAEGPGWVAVDKPAGTPVHPLAEDETGTLLGALRARHPEVQGVGEGGLRSGVVHRLDVDTSGVLLFATREEAWQELRRAFREHRVEKVYRVIVAGRLEGEGAVEVGLLTARHRPARVRVVGETEAESARGVRRASLRWRALEALAGATLLEVRPRTGFLHQIRATLAHLGAPVLGDAVYGGDCAAAAGVGRQMLHAARARVSAAGGVDAASDDPEDFRAVLAALRA